MSIKNEAKIKNPLVVGIREQLEHRALWMYLLCDEAKKGPGPGGLRPRRHPALRTVSGRRAAEKGRRRRLLKGSEKDAVFQVRPVGV